MTQRQAEALAAIRRLTVDGVPPTVRELMLDMGLASSNGVQRVLRGLQTAGLIDWQPRRARTIVVLADQVSDAVLTKLSTEALKDLAHRVYGVLADRKVAS